MNSYNKINEEQMFADHERITTTVNSAVLVLLMTLLSIHIFWTTVSNQSLECGSKHISLSLLGFGLGLSYIPSVTIVGQYFEKKRSLTLRLAVSGMHKVPEEELWPPLKEQVNWHLSKVPYQWLLVANGACSNGEFLF